MRVTSAMVSAHGLNIVRAHLDIVNNPENGVGDEENFNNPKSVSMLR
jgi:hypothetical protein